MKKKHLIVHLFLFKFFSKWISMKKWIISFVNKNEIKWKRHLSYDYDFLIFTKESKYFIGIISKCQMRAKFLQSDLILCVILDSFRVRGWHLEVNSLEMLKSGSLVMTMMIDIRIVVTILDSPVHFCRFCQLGTK